MTETTGLYKGAEPGQPPKRRYRYLYYITHIENIKSILKEGILSHDQTKARNIDYKRIYNEDIVNLRRDKTTPQGHSLWHYANLYLQPRNAMLYLVKRKFGSENIVVLACYRGPAYEIEDALITDGNAANSNTQFFPISQKDKVFQLLRKVDGLEYWSEADGTKRQMMAEVLVPDRFDPKNIQAIHVSGEEVKNKVESILVDSARKPNVIVDPGTFFDPTYETKLTETLTLVKGDMFFSGLHTLTISVNTKGVMGGGLASRTKYQFPDVYTYYQDVCRKGSLKLGHPVLYKREAGIDLQMADTPSQLDSPNNQTWFLLFATKDDYKRPASKEGIIEGLKWVIDNYRNLGLESLAIPALGCGLGWLQWREMGPILCRYLSNLTIPVQLYLPAERPIPEEHLTKSFLMGEF